MSIRSGYFVSKNGDRKYNADTMSKYFSGLMTRGVLQNYNDKLIVKSVSGMTISIGTGKAYFSDGKWIENDTLYNLTIDQSDVVLNRIDRVILKKDKNEANRSCTIEIKKGTPATNPLAPDLANNELVEEMSLATIYIAKLSEAITQANITDTRADSVVCGFVTGLINQVDTSELFLQYQTAYTEQYNQFTTEFEEWFSELREELSTSTLVREYTNRVISTVQDQVVFNIGISNYNSTLDILEVYVNGLRLVRGQEFTLNADKVSITLTKGLDINQPIEFVVFKSIDGYKAETVVDIVEDHEVRITDLESKSSISKAIITLPLSSWTLSNGVYKQTASVDIIKTIDDLLLVSPVENVSVRATNQAVASLTFETTVEPTSDIHVNIANLGA